jgi:hypothetical protein
MTRIWGLEERFQAITGNSKKFSSVDILTRGFTGKLTKL